MKIWLGNVLGLCHVWQLRIKLLKCLQWQLIGNSNLPYLLTWVMIYSFEINTDFVNRFQFDPLPWNVHNSVSDQFLIYSKNNDLFPNGSHLWQCKNHKPPLTAYIQTLSRIVQVRFSQLVDLTWTILDTVSWMRTQRSWPI